MQSLKLISQTMVRIATNPDRIEEGTRLDGKVKFNSPKTLGSMKLGYCDVISYWQGIRFILHDEPWWAKIVYYQKIVITLKCYPKINLIGLMIYLFLICDSACVHTTHKFGGHDLHGCSMDMFSQNLHTVHNYLDKCCGIITKRLMYIATSKTRPTYTYHICDRICKSGLYGFSNYL